MHIEYSHQLHRVYEENGKKYAEFTTRKSSDIDVISIKSHLLLFDYDLGAAKKLEHPLSNDDFDEYLTAEENFEVNNASILAKAEEIGGETKLEIARNIFDFVVGHLEYRNYLNEDRGAKRALKQEQGRLYRIFRADDHAVPRQEVFPPE